MVRCELIRGVLTLRTGEEYTFEEVMRAIRTALDEISTGPGIPLLIDVCESKQTRSRRELVALADHIKTAQGLLHQRCAVLACDMLRYGLARQFSGWAASKGIEVRVFGDGQEEVARQWLLDGDTSAEQSPPIA